jgi:phosphomethylpyrimidine synthase
MTEQNKNGEANGGIQLPNSKKIYVSGRLHEDVRVPFREITLAPTKSMTGEIEANEPVRVYDTSGPWGDNRFDGEVEEGLPPLRTAWIRARGDVEEIAGRAVTPCDDGYLSEVHAETARRNGSSKSQIRQSGSDPNSKKLSTLNSVKERGSHGALRSQPSTLPKRKPLRASANHPVTQLWYARQGIITPEMEFIAIRENLGSERDSSPSVGEADSFPFSRGRDASNVPY